jgi:hypothetical protein
MTNRALVDRYITRYWLNIPTIYSKITNGSQTWW